MARKPAQRDSADHPLRGVIRELSRLYRPAEPSRDAFEIILWENIGYLIDDARRQSLIAEFRTRAGRNAAAIARAPDALLLDIASRGGMRPEMRVARWRQIADIILTECGGDLAARLRDLPVGKARLLLKRFPSIGDPGADRILLFTGIETRPSVETNGLRVLVRLGMVPDRKSYAATYKSASSVLLNASSGRRAWLISAYLLLREHGRVLCKRSAPHCMACPFDQLCAHVKAEWF